MERSIALQGRGRGLNRRADVLTRCWHEYQHLLANWVRSDNAQGGQVPGLKGEEQMMMLLGLKGEEQPLKVKVVTLGPDKQSRVQ